MARPERMRKIQLLPAREQVASALREAILKRELKEGEELTLEDKLILSRYNDLVREVTVPAA